MYQSYWNNFQKDCTDSTSILFKVSCQACFYSLALLCNLQVDSHTDYLMDGSYDVLGNFNGGIV